LDDQPPELDRWCGQGTTPEDLARNYWRDRGHAPFMKPPDAELEGRISSHDPF
jgi:hypothetical protein